MISVTADTKPFKAAELAGISRDEFLIELDRNKIDFIAYDPSDLEKELERF